MFAQALQALKEYGAVVRMFAYDDAVRYTLMELQELWLDELPKKEAPSKVIKLQ